MKEPEITPEIYEEMNKEFIEEGTMVRIEPLTQKQIDDWLAWKCPDMHERTVEPVDMVAEMWARHKRNHVL